MRVGTEARMLEATTPSTLDDLWALGKDMAAHRDGISAVSELLASVEARLARRGFTVPTPEDAAS